MNSKAFMTLFFAVAFVGLVHGLGSLTTVVSGGAVTVPLVSAVTGLGTGGLTTVLAVLGVLKLGAAAILGGVIAAGGAGEEASGYGYRQKRSAEELEEKKDGLFSLVRSLDQLECGKNLVCELEAKSADELESDEAIIVSLFSDRKYKKQVNPASPKAEYDLAAELGLASRNQVICRQRYASCPYTAEEMMNALRNSHL
jgi:hypothetical protein